MKPQDEYYKLKLARIKARKEYFKTFKEVSFVLLITLGGIFIILLMLRAGIELIDSVERSKRVEKQLEQLNNTIVYTNITYRIN